ncbi:hypothetical protein NP493_1249g00076 [Ridgeia piscesae]|uniref:Uncharacterized protein n=1 Tax=Ridgeia piscesae TaxID=27915 RepID=A0AAD9KAA1_RIDPI|nr:hypothetical protein NP493_1249g00076 [Ridgeia piscesae]
MSGGQKQRIAIARALISNPKILLLDEATSALDSESEAIVQDALEKACKGRTTIVVAHRLSTVRKADVIHCLSQGRLIESGSHDELMAREGLYYNLVTNQSKNAEEKPVEDLGTADIKTSETSSSEMSDSMDSQTELKDSYEDDEQELIKHHDSGEGQKSVFLRLLKLNAAEWPYLTLGCIASFLTGSAPPLFALAIGIMVQNFAIENQDDQKTTARKFSIIIICSALVYGFMYCVLHWSFSIAGENLTVRLRKFTFSRMLRQEIGWFDLPENKVGVLTSRLSVDTTVVRWVASGQLGLMISAVSSLVVAFGLAFVSSWKLTLADLVFVPLLMAAGYAMGQTIKGSAKRFMDMTEHGEKIASEAISSIRTVMTLTVEAKFEEKFNSYFDSFVRKEQVHAATGGLFYGFSQSIPQFSYCVAYIYGAHLVSTGEIEFDSIFKVAMALIMASMTVGRSYSFAPDVYKAKLAAKNIFRLLDRKPLIGNGGGDYTCPPECRGEVTLDDIEFTYPSRPDAIILRGLRVTIKPGQRVALVGQSGCGKSTCVSLVERFYDTSRGCVRIDGVDIRSLDVQWVRAQLALVSQEPVLFNTTIYDNIAYGDNTRTPTMDEVIDAAKKANIHNFIASLPLLVQEALERAQEGRTCIVIAHRLSTIRSADKIVVMQEGVVVEEGTHDELMAQKSFYCDLVQKQVGTVL